MYASVLPLAPPAFGRWPFVLTLFAFGLYLTGASLAKPAPERADWFPDSTVSAHYKWHYAACQGCVSLRPPPHWLKMRDLAGLEDVNFLSAPGEQWGHAYSFPPNAIALSPMALNMPECELNFVVGHELVHLAQRHFDEDANTAAVLSGLKPGWTQSGKRALSLLEGDFALAIKMSPMWQEQEREADWVGALLSAQASGCGIAEGALPYLTRQKGFGGGLAAAHDASENRADFLAGFTDPADRLAARGMKRRY